MTKTRSRRDLTQEEIDDARRLEAVYRRWKADQKAEGRPATQEHLAHLCGWSGQSAFSQYAKARIPLNLEALAKLSKALNVDPDQISPRLAEMLPKERSNADMVAHKVGHDGGPPAIGEVDVPYYREVELAAGAGQFEVVENHGYTKRLPLSALDEAGVAPVDAACATLVGDSMSPLIQDGTAVAIDKSFRRIVDGQMYAFDHDGMLRVKYLYRLPMGRIRIASYNSEEYPDEIIGPDEVQFLRIIGRVFWWQTVIPKPPSHLS
ncbi:transcriptional regulator [Billgrantia azerbaijanica]|nr:transcriptional regulator [Halomonas azerbaijanica]